VTEVNQNSTQIELSINIHHPSSKHGKVRANLQIFAFSL